SLLERGVTEPQKHLVLATREKIATLLVSIDPFTAADQATLGRAAEQYGFRLLIAGERPVTEQPLASIDAASSESELAAAVAHSTFDYTPPTDQRPYFFNMLKPAGVVEVLKSGGWRGALGLDAQTRGPGVISGNMAATRTLLALGLISFLGVIL